MGIPIAREYTVELAASVTRHVTCEKCSAQYDYELRRKSIGGGISVLFLNDAGAEATAQERAETSLQRKMKEHDPVPCPCCGWYQRVMIPYARRQFHRWMNWAAAVVLPVGIVFFILAFFGKAQSPPVSDETLVKLWAATVLLLGTSAGLYFGRSIWALYHQPNQTPRKGRIRLGKKRSRLVVAGDAPPPRKVGAKSRR